MRAYILFDCPRGIFADNHLSNYRVQQLLGRNPLEAGKILYSLVSKNMLVSTNKGRWTSYSINADYSQGVESREQKKQEIIDSLIAYCREPHTLQEIAAYLGFSDRYRMKRVYIDPILGDLLEMTSAEAKNSPAQKYRTKE